MDPWVFSLLLDVSANTWDFWRYSESIQQKLCGIQVLPVSFFGGEVQDRRTTKTPRNSACIFPWKTNILLMEQKHPAITRWYGNLSHDGQGSIHPNGGWPWDFWTINSSTWNLVGWKMMTCSFGLVSTYFHWLLLFQGVSFLFLQNLDPKNVIVIMMVTGILAEGRGGTELKSQIHEERFCFFSVARRVACIISVSFIYLYTTVHLWS